MKSLKATKTFLGIFPYTYKSLQKTRKAQGQDPTIPMNWAKGVLKKINVDLEIIGTPLQEEGVLFVGNHISYVDIPLIMATIEKVAFVAKQEIRSWPLFGEGAALIGTVFVKRDKASSREAAKTALSDAIKNGKKVAIFPSGTTTMGNKKPWKKGAFDIAAELGCKVQPFRISYQPLRETAYIDDDFFPTHLMRLLNFKTIKTKIEFHEPVVITDPIKDCEKWDKWADPEKVGVKQ